jgi:hypothetical protein
VRGVLGRGSRAGPRGDGPENWAVAGGKSIGERGEVGWAGKKKRVGSLFFLSFSNQFQTNFSNRFKSNILHIFKFKLYHKFSLTILKTFQKPF